MANRRFTFFGGPNPVQHNEGPRAVIPEWSRGVITNRPSTIHHGDAYEDTTESESESQGSNPTNRTPSSSIPSSPVDASSSNSENTLFNTPSHSSGNTSPASLGSGSSSNSIGDPASPVHEPGSRPSTDSTKEEHRLLRLQTRYLENLPMDDEEYFAVHNWRMQRGLEVDRSATREELLAEMDWVRVNRLKKEPFKNCFARWHR